MSDLSKIKNAFMSFLGKLEGGIDPSVQPTVQAAADDVHTAITEAETAAVSEAGALVSTAVPTPESARTKAVAGGLAPVAPRAGRRGGAELTSRLQAVSKPATA